MTNNTFIRLGFSLVMALGLAACGGGGGGGPTGGGDEMSFSPVAGVTMTDVENRTGISADQTVAFDSAAGTATTTDFNRQARSLIGNITFVRGSQNGADQGVETRWDANANGQIDTGFENTDTRFKTNFNPSDPTREVAPGVPAFETSQDGGVVRAITRVNATGRIEDVIYVPASAAQEVYGGMYVHQEADFGQGRILVGTFGRNSSATDLQRLRDAAIASPTTGTGTYAGRSHALVLRDGDATIHETSATGAIDFGTNEVTANTTLNGGGTIDITATYNADGRITGDATYGNIFNSGTVSGQANGQIYGPNADTVGMTYTGNGDAGTNSIAGGMLLNRTDQR